MAAFFACASFALVAMVAADLFVFDARNCNTNGDNPQNFATNAMLKSGTGPVASSLQFAGADGDTTSHVFKPVDMLLNAGEYAIGELDLPEGFNIELSEGAEVAVSADASGDPAVFTGGQYMKAECNTNCKNNWLKYVPSATNPAALPPMNPTLDYTTLPQATSVPCLTDDVHFHFSSSYAVDAYGTQMYNSINYRNLSLESGTAGTLTAISGGESMFLGPSATTTCESMGMTGSSCTCLSSCDESDTQRNFVRDQLQSAASAMKVEEATLISGEACDATGSSPVDVVVPLFTSQNMLQSDVYAKALGPNLQQLTTSICDAVISETCVTACTISSITIENPQSGAVVRRNTGLATEVFSMTMAYSAPVAFNASQMNALTNFVSATVTTSSIDVLPLCMSLETDVDYGCIEAKLKLDVVPLYDGSKSIAAITSSLEALYMEYRGCNIQELGSGQCSFPASTFVVVGGYDAAATAQMNTIIQTVISSVETSTTPTTDDPNLGGDNLGNTGENDSSASSVPLIPIAAGAGGLLLIIIVIVLVMTRGDAKEEDHSRDVVAFQNPMYDSPEEKQNPVADGGDGLYDDPQIVGDPSLVGGYLDVSQSITLDNGDNDDAAGLYDDGTGYDEVQDDGGYLDVHNSPGENDDEEQDDEDDDDDDEDAEDDDDDDDEDDDE
eukprot:m.391153 g.391153  ORF g.391153 m.391153 type:complete len:671 (-) comp21071_c0_seq1:337-2349(-)